MDGTQPSPEDVPPGTEAPFWDGETDEAPLAAQPTESVDPEEHHPDAEIAIGTGKLDHKLFLWLFAGCGVATLGIIPYSVTLLSQSREDPFGGMPRSVALILSVIVEVAISAGLIAMGMAAGRRIPWGVPPLRALLSGGPETVHRVRASLVPALIVGIGLGTILALIDWGVESDRAQGEPQIIMPPAWEGLLASISAAIREEIWFRLGCMTLFAWIGTLLVRPFLSGRVVPPVPIVWIANLFAALLFAAIHLPQAHLLIGLSTPILVFVVLGNGLPGMIFGWLYWRRGLIAAIVAHFGFDLVLKVVIPLFS
jgi:membrane protease YdiL (CAAX protease family)